MLRVRDIIVIDIVHDDHRRFKSPVYSRISIPSFTLRTTTINPSIFLTNFNYILQDEIEIHHHLKERIPRFKLYLWCSFKEPITEICLTKTWQYLFEIKSKEFLRHHDLLGADALGLINSMT